MNKIPTVDIIEFANEGLRATNAFTLMKMQRCLQINSNEKKYFIYSKGLAAILTLPVLPCRLKNGSAITIDGNIYLPSFYKGYDEGQKYFKENYINDIFRTPETIANDLNHHYYHGDNPYTNYIEGFPTILSATIVEKWGYYNGIVHEFYDFVKQHPTLFVNLIKNNESLENGDLIAENSIEAQDSSQGSKLTINQIALIHCYGGVQITRENGNQIAEEYNHNSGEKLYQRFTFYSSPTNRKGKPNLCTQRKLKNKINLLKSVIELLPQDKRNRANDEVKLLENIMENEFH